MALIADGTNSPIVAGINANVQIDQTSIISFAGWFYFPTGGAGTSLLTWSGAFGSAGLLELLYQYSKLEIAINDSNTMGTLYGPDLPAGWNFIGFTLTDPATSTFTFSVNGTEFAFVAAPNSASNSNFPFSLWIGNTQYNTTTPPAGTAFSDLAYWLGAISLDDLRALARGANPMSVRSAGPPWIYLPLHDDLIDRGRAGLPMWPSGTYVPNFGLSAPVDPIPRSRRLYYAAPSGGNFTASLSDTLSVTDSFTETIAATGALADTISPTDAYTESMAASATLADTETVTDTFSTTVEASLSDTIAASDSFVGSLAANTTLSDTLSLSDNFTESMAADATFSDSVSATDSFTAALAYFASLSDTLSPSDSFISSLSASVAFSDTLTLSDNFTESMAAAATFGDSVSPSDSFTASTPGNYSASLSDTLSLSDTYTSALSAQASISDSLSLTDNFTSNNAAAWAFADSISVSDSVSAQLSATASWTDTLTGSDSYTGGTSGNYTAIFADTLSALDNYSVAAHATAALADALSITDVFIGYTSGLVSDPNRILSVLASIRNIILSKGVTVPITLRYTPKDPAEIAVFTADFTPDLASGETITSASIAFYTNVSPPQPTNDFTLIQTTINTTQVLFKISGGTAGTDYVIKVTATTTLQVLPRSFLLYVGLTS